MGKRVGVAATRRGVLSSLIGIALALGGCQADHKPIAPGQVEVVQTSRDLSQRLTRLPRLRFVANLPPGLPVIDVSDDVRYQRVIGVGAALTDTSAWLLHDELAPAAGATVIRNLFGASGIHLGFLRVPIGSTDFTRNRTPYSYDDLPAGESDPTLSRFSVQHDDSYIIPMLRQMLSINAHVVLLASQWSPPAWMKRNQSLGNHANGGALLPSAYAPMADYYVKFIQAYAARGVRIDALTAQNEPGQQSKYPGLNMSEPDEAKFISGYLAPGLRRSGLQVAVYAHDFKWLLEPRAMALASDPALAHVIAGIAWHCYDGNPNVMSVMHAAHPGLAQLESECSSGSSPGPPSELIIASFRNWANGVLLWNLALDPRGGPVEPPNKGCPHCTGVITVDERSHTVRYGSDYYELGQFSAFVQPGAHRIASNNFVAYNSHTRTHRVNYATAGIDDVAFENPNGSKVLLVHNNARRPERFGVAWRRDRFAYTLPAGATVTFSWR